MIEKGLKAEWFSLSGWVFLFMQGLVRDNLNFAWQISEPAGFVKESKLRFLSVPFSIISVKGDELRTTLCDDSHDCKLNQ